MNSLTHMVPMSASHAHPLPRWATRVDVVHQQPPDAGIKPQIPGERRDRSGIGHRHAWPLRTSSAGRPSRPWRSLRAGVALHALRTLAAGISGGARVTFYALQPLRALRARHSAGRTGRAGRSRQASVALRALRSRHGAGRASRPGRPDRSLRPRHGTGRARRSWDSLRPLRPGRARWTRYSTVSTLRPGRARWPLRPRHGAVGARHALRADRALRTGNRRSWASWACWTLRTLQALRPDGPGHRRSGTSRSSDVGFLAPGHPTAPSSRRSRCISRRLRPIRSGTCHRAAKRCRATAGRRRSSRSSRVALSHPAILTVPAPSRP